ncbi:MAG: S8 family serine peptidase [Chloroflexi bacterium]|nr:S8 family serine peptidase [Chloroflexota bacterium]
MKRWRHFILVAALFSAVFFIVLSMSSSSLKADTLDIADSSATHKVIAAPGVLNAAAPGITLWYDYGAFALYKVSDTTLARLPAASQSKITLADDMDWIMIDAYPFNSQTDDLTAVPQSLTAVETNAPALHLIQFVGPIRDEWLEAVKDAGAVPVQYVVSNAYLVWADGNSRAQLDKWAADGDFMQFSDLYQPYFKLGESLRQADDTGKVKNDLVKVTVQMLRHEGESVTEDFVKETTVTAHTNWEAILNYQNIIVTMHRDDITRLAQQPDVTWVGEWFERELTDEVQAQIIANHVSGGSPSGTGYLTWLNGLGFSANPPDYPVVDIVDDGIGTGSVNSSDSTLHEFGSTSNPTRLVYVDNCTSSSNGAGPDGHGHINVSIAGGYDTRSGFPFRDPNGYQRGQGMNPYGRYAGTRIFDNSGFDLVKCSNTDTGLIKSSQDSGADITSNSWGCSGCASQYDSSSQAFDVGVRDADLTQTGNQELIMFFSAGNSGSGSGTIGTPGNGKNMITVGASENVRPNDEDGNWTDGCAIGSSGANDWRDIISFSSRGPAPGGRVKPEVIAPGTHIQGTASTNGSYNGSSVCDQYRPSGQTTFAASSGTSHSTPALAGVSSLYYYWLENNYGLTPSPAMMKSYMIAHPTYLTGTGANDTLPSNSQGYGMPNLETAFDNTSRVLIDQSQLFGSSGQTWTWNGQVADSGKPVRIVLAYTDAAGSIGTSPQVNNLNLSATINGSAYLGNRFSGQWSATGGSADNANNYEAVFRPSGTSGNIDITVTAFNISGDGVPGNGDSTDQDFALVCYNCVAGGPTPTATNTSPPPTPTNTPAPGACTTYTSTDVPISMPNGVTLISSNLTVNGSGTIDDLNVSVDMPHAWPGDLSFVLRHQDTGTAVTIIDRPGVPASTYGCSIDDILATLDDEAAAAVENQCAGSPPAINGTFIPNNSLSAFDGENGNGTWLLEVTDHYTSGDSGSLNGWSVEICNSGVVPTNTPAPPTDTPVPPTDTPVPPTPTNTSVPPTPTNTSVPPTPTNTTVPPTPTNTPLPPTPTNTPPPGGADVIYVGSSSGGNVGGVSFADEDIVAYDTDTGTWAMYFDGSDVGLGNNGAADVDAFHLLNDGTILLSFIGAPSIPDVGSVDDSDIVRFVPTSTGSSTAGTYEWYFDGSDVNLTTSGEDVDAIGIAPDGRLMLSTSGSFNVGISGRDEDILYFDATSLGANTSGSWAMAFDGSDVALHNSGNEDVIGTWINDTGADLYLTTRGDFSVSGLSGDGSDIFVCENVATGSSTSCSSFSLYFDGSANGYGSERMDGFFVER